MFKETVAERDAFLIPFLKLTIRLYLNGSAIEQENQNQSKKSEQQKFQCYCVHVFISLVSQCIDSEEDAVELLHNIIFLWVTIRGFSLVATWMEMYKKSIHKTTKQKKSLRIDLKQSMDDMVVSSAIGCLRDLQFSLLHLF